MNDNRVAMAELEEYGLSVRTMNSLEDNLGVVWLDQMETVDEEMVLACHRIGGAAVAELKTAMRNWLAGRKTREFPK